MNISTLTLHLNEGCNPITLIFDHIVAYIDMGKYTEVFTSSGVSFEVIESKDFIDGFFEHVANETDGYYDYKKIVPAWYFKSPEEFFPELSVRAICCIKNAGISTVGQLVKMSEDDLCKTRNIGKKSLAELKQALSDKNLSLGMSEDDIREVLFKDFSSVPAK